MFGYGKFRIHLPMAAASVVSNENVLGVRERILFHVERPALVSLTDMNEFRRSVLADVGFIRGEPEEERVRRGDDGRAELI